ncbi:MAG: TraR/DksA family transcriptional regulator [Candidatus Acidiferrum sp.]
MGEEAMPTVNNSKQSKQWKMFEDLLRSRLAELKSHLDLMRKEMIVEDEVDDEAMQASRNGNRELAIITMDREIRNISEIEQALERIARNEYGICITCEKTIPNNRLKAIPWTRQCVDCAGGGINRRQGPTFGQPAFGSALAR